MAFIFLLCPHPTAYTTPDLTRPDPSYPVGYRNSGRGLIFADETAQHVPPVNSRGPKVIDRWP